MRRPSNTLRSIALTVISGIVVMAFFYALVVLLLILTTVLTV